MKMITPRIVRIEGVNTPPKVPRRLGPCGESVGALLSPKYTVRLLDTSVGGISLSRTTGCTACNPDEAADRLSGVVREVLQRGLQQERSTLEITSVPEAVVTVDGRRVGRTPFLREVLSGAHEITLTAIGYNPHRAKLVAQEHRKATLSVNLSVASTLGPNLPVPPAAPVYELRESRGPRPPCPHRDPRAGGASRRGVGRRPSTRPRTEC